MTIRLSPHCRADSSADCACTSANDCTRRSCDEKAASATETCASQNRTATYPQRGSNNEHHPTHPTFPQRGNYLQQFLTAGESRCVEKGTRSGSLSLQFRSADYARRPSSGPSRLACTHACRRGGPSYPSGIRAWPPTYRVYQEALPPATSRSSRRGHKILGHNIHGDMHASHICGGRQQRSRVLAVARYGIAPCPRTKTYLCLGIDEAISAPRTALLLPIESLQSRLSFSCASPPEATVA